MACGPEERFRAFSDFVGQKQKNSDLKDTKCHGTQSIPHCLYTVHKVLHKN